MSGIETKKKVVQQAVNPTAPAVTPTLNTQNGSSGITTPKINQYTNPNSQTSSVGAPGALTGTNPNSNPMMRSTVSPAPPANPVSATNPTVNPQQRTGETTNDRPPSLVDQLKPTLDGMQQADKDFLDKWQQAQNDRLNSEYQDSLKAMEQSKIDAENWYKKSKDETDTNLYNQQEQLNIDGTNRGISNSAQILGLQGVHNINYNKNLTKLMEDKSKLLSDITNKINSLNTQFTNNKNDIALGVLDKNNSINKDYNKQQIDLLMQKYKEDYDRYLTQDDRKYQEWLKQNDREYDKATVAEEREWQKEWLKYQLETEKNFEKTGKSGYSGRNASGGYGGYSNYKYTPWSDWSKNYQGYTNGYSSGGSNGVDFGDPSVLNAGIQSYKNASTDAYNSITNTDTTPLLDNFNEMSSLYDEVMSPYESVFGSAPKEYQDEVKSTKNVAKDHMFNQAKAFSTNTPFKQGDTYITPALPWRAKTIETNKAKAEVMDRARRGNDFGAKTASNAYDIHKKVMDKNVKSTSTKKAVTNNKRKENVTSVGKSKPTKKEVQDKHVKTSIGQKQPKRKETVGKKKVVTKSQMKAEAKKGQAIKAKAKSDSKKREAERNARTKKQMSGFKKKVSGFFKKMFK